MTTAAAVGRLMKTPRTPQEAMDRLARRGVVIRRVMEKYTLGETPSGYSALVFLPEDRERFIGELLLGIESADADSNPSSSTDKETRRSE